MEELVSIQNVAAINVWCRSLALAFFLFDMVFAFPSQLAAQGCSIQRSTFVNIGVTWQGGATDVWWTDQPADPQFIWVEATPGCSVTATSDIPWLTISSPATDGQVQPTSGLVRWFYHWNVVETNLT